MNQRGMSMVEILMAMGLLGLVSIGVIKLLENMNQGVNSVSKRSQIQSFSDNIKNRIMGQRDSCTLNAMNAFNGLSLGAGQSLDGKPSYNKLFAVKPDGTPAEVLREGKISLDQSFRIDNLKFTLTDIEALSGTGTYTHKAQFNIVYNTSYCSKGGKIADCTTAIKKYPSELPPVEIVFTYTGSSIGGIECKTMDTPLLKEANNYTDMLKERVCALEKVVADLTGAAMTDSCGNSYAPDSSKIVKLYEKDDGGLSKNVQYLYIQKDCSWCGSGNCNPPACPSGYTQYNFEKKKICSWTDPTCCGAKRKWRNYRYCRKAKPSVGHMIKSI